MTFSIIIPVFNVEPYIAECIYSCLRQEFRDFEIIIVDDCGSDGSLEIIQSIDDLRIRIIHNPKNLGLFASRRVGEAESCGRYILHLDGDDKLGEGILNKLYEASREREWDIIGFQSKSFLKKKLIPKMPIGSFGNDFWTDNFFVCGKAYRRELVFLWHQMLPVYNYKLNNAEDVLMNLCLYSLARDYRGVGDIGYLYRIRENSITTSISSKKTQDIQWILKQLLEDSQYSLMRFFPQAVQILKSAYWIEQRYFGNYLICCVRAFCVFPRMKTFARILIFCLSLGFVKL